MAISELTPEIDYEQKLGPDFTGSHIEFGYPIWGDDTDCFIPVLVTTNVAYLDSGVPALELTDNDTPEVSDNLYIYSDDGPLFDDDWGAPKMEEKFDVRQLAEAAEILLADTTLTELSAFERAQLDYVGHDQRSTPGVSYDDDMSERLTATQDSLLGNISGSYELNPRPDGATTDFHTISFD